MQMERLRIDKWLWAARFYKTRSLATDEIDKGRVAINGQEVKPAREVKVGDTVSLRREGLTRTVVVKGVSDVRGPAPAAQALYEETPESLKAREQAADQRRFAREPALSIEHGRPTKRGRRELDEAQRQDWGDRWSASIDGGTPPKR
jgi:ribosome-associated heat shock protein Hsp15